MLERRGCDRFGGGSSTTSQGRYVDNDLTARCRALRRAKGGSLHSDLDGRQTAGLKRLLAADDRPAPGAQIISGSRDFMPRHGGVRSGSRATPATGAFRQSRSAFPRLRKTWRALAATAETTAFAAEREHALLARSLARNAPASAQAPAHSAGQQWPSPLRLLLVWNETRDVATLGHCRGPPAPGSDPAAPPDRTPSRHPPACDSDPNQHPTSILPSPQTGSNTRATIAYREPRSAPAIRMADRAATNRARP